MYDMARNIGKLKDIHIEQPVPINVYPQYIPPKKSISDRERTIAKKFDMPYVAIFLIDFFFSEEDQAFIEKITTDDFPAAEVSPDYLKSAFSRGILSRLEEDPTRYRLNHFYGMLDVFCVSQTEKYRTLPRSLRKELDDWYFNRYAAGLDADLKKRPTADRVLTLEEMLAFIDGLREPLYLAYCDCKSLSGDCGLPSRTCINFAPGRNSFAARGAAAPITREEAKEVIRKADKVGLVHTVSDHGICNCCDDCCYLFRCQQVRGSVGFWPMSPHIVEFDKEKCVSCGKCQSRCRFKVFKKLGSGKQAHMEVDRKNCIGCGLCAGTCPTKALGLADRRADQMQIAGERISSAF